MESNYKIAYDKFWQDIKQRDPQEIAASRELGYDGESGQFLVKYFNEDYVVDSHQETIYRLADGATPEIMDAIIILNYLAYAAPLQPAEPKWVSLKEIPGGMIFYSAFQKTAINDLIEAFGEQAARLLTVACSLGGQPAAHGDAAAVFKAFPEIPLCVVAWEGDEEVKANATILFDPSIVPMLHSETIIGLGMQLARKLRNLARQSDALQS